MTDRNRGLGWGTACLSVLALVTAAGYAHSGWWILEIPAHFRPQLATVSAIVLGLALVRRRRLIAFAAAALLAANAGPFLPYMAPGAAASAAPGSDLRILTLNMFGRGTDVGALHALLAEENPDVVVLTELPWGVRRLAASLAPTYPYTLLDHRRSGLDVLILSRWRPAGWTVDRSAAPGAPVTAARLCSDGAGERCVWLVAFHSARPYGELRPVRDRQYAAAARLVGEGKPLPTVLVGDLNSTPWAPSFSDLLTKTGLEDASGKVRFAATWNSRSLLFGLPLDHILTSPDIRVAESRVGADVGSDHFPVIARLAVGSPARGPD